MTDSKSPKPALGDIVLAPFPFADRSITKLRPAMIISSLPAEAWLVAYVTSASTHASEYDVALTPDETNHLKVESFVRVNRLTVISTDMISRTLGSLSVSQRQDITDKLSLMSQTFSDH